MKFNKLSYLITEDSYPDLSVKGSINEEEFYGIEGEDLLKIQKLMYRLYTEEKMHPDEMRDWANLLNQSITIYNSNEI